MMKRSTKKPPSDLLRIPGVGPSIARDLVDLGYQKVDDLRGANPERMFDRSNRQRGLVQDRCLLYVFRCAVYFAETSRPDSRKLKWWYWNDGK